MDEREKNDFKLHLCELQSANVAIVGNKLLDKNNKIWRLEISRQVTEQDLEENHNFETLEDVVWQTSVEIHFCPYCGEKLIEQNPPNGWQAKMAHFDYSGWNVQQR